MHLPFYARLLFLPVQAMCVQRSCTPPLPPPPPEEQARYNEVKGTKVGEKGFTVIHASAVAKYIVFGINILELVALLTHAGYITSSHLATLRGILKTDTVPSGILVGTLLMTAGTALRVAAYRHLGRFFTYQLSLRRGHQLVTDGPYGLVRHPSYTALATVFLGSVIAQLGPGSVWTRLGLWRQPVGVLFGMAQIALVTYVSWVLCFLRVPKEDVMMRERFRYEWEAWAKRTPYKLIPYVY